jgi:hypothetical protein
VVKKTTLAGIGIAMAMMAMPRPAEASCAIQPAFPAVLDSARVVFVGTVTSTSDRDRRATVRVETIWKGPDLPAVVEVFGSPVVGGGAATSVDRSYQVGVRYLFVPTNDGPPFQDNACTPTRPYTPEVAAYIPADARQVQPASEDRSWFRFWPFLLIPVAVAGLSISAFVIRRKGRI